jgi:ER-bound oxygenase mpaB/B'/Rubber oxygenase, catalytic domain
VTVAHEVIPPKVLNRLRLIGDPDLDPLLTTTSAKTFRTGVLTDPLLGEQTTIAKKFFGVVPHTPVAELDVDRLMDAQRLFASYGSEISGALLLAALPQSYAAQWASRALVASTRLQDDFRRRILGTSQFLVVVMRGAKSKDDIERYWTKGDDPYDATLMVPWKACLAVRLYHAAIRKTLPPRDQRDQALTIQMGKHNDVPINQEDLLATLLTFTVTVFEVLERYGISWTVDDQRAYLEAWDLIGKHLGIGSDQVIADLAKPVPNELKPQGRDAPPLPSRREVAWFQGMVEEQGWHGLRPPTIAATRRLLDQLRARQWPPLDVTTPIAGGDDEKEWEGARSGRVLVRALLNELIVAMPWRMRGAPLSVMRALAPDIVRQRLSLGGSGIVLSLVDLFPKRHATIGRFTAQPVTNPVGGAVLRTLANQVTTHVIVNFTRNGDLRLPGLEAWSKGLPPPVKARLVP